MTVEGEVFVEPASTEADAFEHMVLSEDAAAREKALLAEVADLRREVAQLRARPRLGEALLAALAREIPWLEKEIRGSQCDPSRDDGRIGKMLLAMQRRLAGGSLQDAEEWRVLFDNRQVIVEIRPTKAWEEGLAYGRLGSPVRATHVGAARDHYLGVRVCGVYGLDPRVICAEIAGQMRLPVKRILGPGEGA
jgi:hypothetical protein